MTHLLWDLDGVVLHSRTQYFSDRLAEQGAKVDQASVKHFFKNIYPDVAIGKLDLPTAIEPYLSDWGWTGTVDELLQYWFTDETNVNPDVVALIKDLNTQGIHNHLASDHSRYRADDLLQNQEIADLFDRTYFSGYLGVTKEQPQFFTHVLSDLNITPDQLLFIDDDPHNLAVANQLQIPTHHFDQDNSVLIASINTYLRN